MAEQELDRKEITELLNQLQKSYNSRLAVRASLLKWLGDEDHFEVLVDKDLARPKDLVRRIGARERLTCPATPAYSSLTGNHFNIPAPSRWAP